MKGSLRSAGVRPQGCQCERCVELDTVVTLSHRREKACFSDVLADCATGTRLTCACGAHVFRATKTTTRMTTMIRCTRTLHST